MSYHGKVVPGGPPGRPGAGEADHHEVLGRRHGQQRLPAALPGDRRAGAGRRRGRRRAGSSRSSAPTACAGWSPRTGTGTTTARSPEVVAATGATTVAGEADADELPVPVDERVSDGDTVQVGECRLEVIHLVGHTPGSIALLYDDPDGTPHLFTGDSLFPGGVGKTWSPEDFTSLVRRRLDQAVRPAARRDLVLPRARQRLDPGRRASAPRRVAVPGLVTAQPLLQMSSKFWAYCA